MRRASSSVRRNENLSAPFLLAQFPFAHSACILSSGLRVGLKKDSTRSGHSLSRYRQTSSVVAHLRHKTSRFLCEGLYISLYHFRQLRLMYLCVCVERIVERTLKGSSRKNTPSLLRSSSGDVVVHCCRSQRQILAPGCGKKLLCPAVYRCFPLPRTFLRPAKDTLFKF